MKPFSAFYPRILPYLPGCPEPLVAQALLNTAIEFCEASQVLRQDLDVFTTTVGNASYELESPSSQLVIGRVMGVILDDVYNLQAVMSEVVGTLPTQNARPRGFYTDRTDSEFTLRLTPTPDDVYDVRVNVALRPSMTATQLEDDLYNIWIDPLVAGTMSRCMMVPDQPFTNFAMANALSEKEAKGVNSSRIEGMYGLTRGSMRVRSRPFA